MASTLRRIVDVVTVLGAAAVVAGFAGYEVDRRHRADQVRHVADEVRRFELTIKLNAATEEGDVNGRGWPVWVDPTWFEGSPPRNTLLSPDRPWVEVATPDQQYLMHPEIRVALSKDLAGFWYNPYQGVVRARVPMATSDAATLDLYNQVNGTSLRSIFADDDPGTVPGAPLADDPTAQDAAASDGQTTAEDGAAPEPAPADAADPSAPATDEAPESDAPASLPPTPRRL